jgi:L-2,4-diaminobutyric acid acetyltransferase
MVDEFIFRSPLPYDGKHLYKLAIESNSLDVNSEYAYILLGCHFQESCAVVEHKKKIIGFASGYYLPSAKVASGIREESLFIWQIAISHEYRRLGLAKKLVLELLRRPSSQTISAIRASVTSLDSASAKLFRKLAGGLGAEFSHDEFMEKEMFSTDHDTETLITVRLPEKNTTTHGEKNENGY